MDAFRGLGDLPERMGFTAPNGGRVSGLPYAEGQLLVTLTDDWRRIRLEPQLLAWGSRSTQAANIGFFNICALAAGRLALRLNFVGITGSGGNIVCSRTNITGLVVLTEAPIVPLEAPTHLPTGGVSTVAAARVLQFSAIAAPFLNVLGWRLPSGTSVHGTWLPRLLLPGEFLVFQSDVTGAPLDLGLSWEQPPSLIDVLTSRAVPVEPQIGP